VHVLRRGEEPGAFFAQAQALIVAVKSYDTVTALRPLRARLPLSTPLVSVQNGLDQVSDIEEALGDGRPIVLAPTTEAATRVVGGIARAGRGLTRLGWAAGHAGTDELDALLETFRAAGLRVELALPIEPHVWAKLVVNAALNPVAALARQPNGFVLDNEPAKLRLGALAQEAARVAAAEGIPLPFADPVAFVLDVARLTAANRCSLLQDLERGAPTEIEAINGALVRLARRNGVPVPENVRALDEVRRAAKA
jgi:2-dehydropantoate 2-reductase